MLRHKYTKKRLKNSRKKRTRKQRGGGGNSSKSSKHRSSQRRKGERLNRSRLNQSPPEDTLSPGEIRNLAQFKALENGEKCESVNHVNDDGSIDCPKTRSLARKKILKFHEDKNPGCREYANDMMSQYNKTCYGDDQDTDIKWDKNDKTWRNDKFTGFYQDPTTSEYVQSQGVQSQGEQKNYNNVTKCENTKCSTCIGEKCKCGRLGVVKDGNKVGYNGYGVNGDKVCHNNSIKTRGEFYNSSADIENKSITKRNENGLPSSCRRPAKKMVCRYCQAKGVTDPKCKCCVGTDMAKKAIAKEQNQQPVSDVPLPMVDLNQPIMVTQPAPVLALENIPSISEIDTQISQPLHEPLPETKLEIIPTPIPTPGPTTGPTCFISQPDPNSGEKYWVERKTDGTFTDTSQWEEPPLEQQCKDLKPTWDASKTVGNCREMDLHPGTEYWINPADGSMSFEPIDGVEKQIVLEETDYYYNSNGETTFDPNDGTCGETKEETKAKEDFISLFFTSHFNKMQELDSGVERKVIPWLSR
jgi:hypothetical protein